MRTIIHQSPKHAFVSAGKRSAIYVKRGQFFPPGVAAPPPCEHPAIGNLFAYLDSGEMERLWDDVPPGSRSVASDVRKMLWETHSYSCECAAYAASLLASNADIGGKL